MSRLEIRRNRNNYEVLHYFGNGKKGSPVYCNILDKDPKKIAQVILDLDFEGYPMEQAVTEYLRRKNGPKKDWLGL